MINNLVIKVDGNLEQLDNSILVYNSQKKVWEVQRKEAFLTEINRKIKELDSKIDKFNKENCEKITKINNNVSKIAKIMKKEIK